MLELLSTLAALVSAHPVLCACAGATVAACAGAPLVALKSRARKLKAIALTESESLDGLGAEAHICAHHLAAIHAAQDAAAQK